MALGAVGIAAAVVIFALVSGDGVKTYRTVAGVDCQSGERLDYHVHSHLTIFLEGEQVKVPANVGVVNECLFWLHTHDDSGIIHIEAPEASAFTLGQFFEIWGQPLSGSRLLDRVADSGHQVRATVNGEEFTGDPSSIALADLEAIVLQYGPPFVAPPASPFGQ